MTKNNRQGLATLTLSILLVGFLAGAGGAAAHQNSTSDLLLPYFEVDLSGTGTATIFSIINSSRDPVTAAISVHSNWGIEILGATLALDGDAVKMIDLKKWLVDGKLPGRTLDAAELEHVQAALSGQRSPRDDLYYSTATALGVASGYVKIHLENTHGRRDQLFGEYFIVDSSEDFAQGDFLIPMGQAVCPSLCDRHGVRFLAGGGFDGGTEIVIWSQRRGEPSDSPYYEEAQMVQADALAFRDSGDQIARIGLGFLPLQVIKVSELGLSSPFGWLDLLTEDDVVITLRLSASHRFSVGFQTFCLPPRPPEEPPGGPEQATLTLIKHVINDDGGTFGPGDFPLFIDGQQVATGVATKVEPGTYTASEISTPDYSPGLWGGDCGPDGVVTIAAGEHKVCEITNDDLGTDPVETKLTLIKQVVNDDGGTLGVSDFPLFIDGQQVTSGVANDVDPGSYTASEQNKPGYTAGSWGGDCDADGHVTLDPGEHKTCVIVNDDDEEPPPPTHLTLVKQVINDDGGTLGVSDFPLFINGQQVTSGVANVMAPGSYTASEQNKPGYTAGSWGGDCDANGHVILEEGDSKTCVIVNDDDENPPPPTYLTLVKQVINDDGGTLGVSDFPLFINGQQVVSGVANVMAPGSYTASEQNKPGYTAGSWGGDCDANGHVTLEEGDSKTCVIVNDDDEEPPPPAYLTLVKQVINDDGGTLGVSDFPLFIDGQQVVSGVANEVDPGSYTASEQNKPGYTAGTWGGDCDADGHVTLEAGDSKTCVIVNDDDEAPPEVTPDRMTGGGSVFLGKDRYTHGFELHCDTSEPNNLEINWGIGDNFHLTNLASAVCSDDPSIEEAPPVAGFDTFTGSGTGRLNGVDGATITFTFTDAGEPGKGDFAQFTIVPPDGGPAISVAGLLHNGNHQAHGN